MMELDFEMIRTRNTELPERGTDKSAGLDFFVPYDFNGGEILLLDPGCSIVIPSGIYVKMNPGKALIFSNKSGVAVKQSIIVGACVIDEDYQGEIFLNMHNISRVHKFITPGQKMVQGIIHNVYYEKPAELTTRLVFDEDNEVKNQELKNKYLISMLYDDTHSERGEGMTGSTGLFKEK